MNEELLDLLSLSEYLSDKLDSISNILDILDHQKKSKGLQTIFEKLRNDFTAIHLGTDMLYEGLCALTGEKCKVEIYLSEELVKSMTEAQEG